MTIEMRSARPEDVDDASILIYAAYRHIAANNLDPSKRENPFIQLLKEFFQQDGNRFSYQQTTVAIQQDQVIGVLLSFGGRDEVRLNKAAEHYYQQLSGQHEKMGIAKEAHNDEWYIDALAVSPAWGGQGIGTQLLKKAEQQAREHGYKKIALNVAKENTDAFRLYQHSHYIVEKETLLYQTLYVHMVKSLS